MTFYISIYYQFCFIILTKATNNIESKNEIKASGQKLRNIIYLNYIIAFNKNNGVLMCVIFII